MVSVQMDILEMRLCARAYDLRERAAQEASTSCNGGPPGTKEAVQIHLLVSFLLEFGRTG